MNLANEPDFRLGELTISPSSGRVRGGGAEARAEAQTMAVLVVLAKANGTTITREDLVARCWQGRVVSDDAIARTIAKVRSLARTVSPAAFIVETVPKIGYLLRVETSTSEPAAHSISRDWTWALPGRLRHPAAVGTAGAVLAVAIGWIGFTGFVHPPLSGGWALIAPTSIEIMDALLNVDQERTALYLQRGWDPNWHLDAERNTALQNLMIACERNPAHDQEGVLHIAQALVAAGADPNLQNKWGDTALIIARSPRYCGPDHPVVAYLQTLDAGGAQPHP